MSILTKISIVILLVLVLLACPVFITQATVHPNYKDAYLKQLERSGVAEMSEKSAKLALNNTITERDEAVQVLNNLKLQKQGEIGDLKAALATLNIRNAELTNDLTTLTTKVAGLDGGLKKLNDRTELLASQLDAARKEIDARTTENINLTDLLKQAEAEKSRQNEAARVHAEQIYALDEEINKLKAAGVTGRPGEEVIPTADQPIEGTVTTVRGDIASINIGSAHGVKRNMKLVIYRGAQLVGWLRIEDVDISQAAGIIINKVLDPMQNDKVTDSLTR